MAWKDDTADFHMIATWMGCGWTKTIRRLPMAYDAHVAFGQIGTKSTPLLMKIPRVLLPPDMAPGIRAEEARNCKATSTTCSTCSSATTGRRTERQAGPDDEASDPKSLASFSIGSTSRQALMVNDDSTFDDLDPAQGQEGVL